MNFLLIDGYNLLACREGSLHHPALPLERLRQRLLDLLAEYARARSAQITVVFDGTAGPSSTAQREVYRGLTVLYSAAGRTADQEIQKIIRQRDRAWMVVSSDREIRQTALDSGLAVVDSASFSERVDFALFSSTKGIVEEREELPPQRREKKGPRHRLSKKEKKKQQTLRKL